MATLEKITELQWYNEGNKISKGLRWIQPLTNLNRHKPLLVLDKENNIVGSYSGDMPILFDESYENKWQGKEMREKYTQENYLKLVSQEKMLLHFCQALFQLAKSEPNKSEREQNTCLHARTKFTSLADSTCPECDESISPSLVIGSLLMACAELNEHIWEQREKKSEKEAVVKEDE